jgi:hypothetical protein
MSPFETEFSLISPALSLHLLHVADLNFMTNVKTSSIPGL